MSAGAAKIDPPKMPDRLENRNDDVRSLRAKDDFSQGSVSDIVLDSQHAEKVSFEKFVFRHTTFTECSLTGLELTDVVFEKCDFSNVSLTDSFLHRTEFIQCKLIGTDFTRSRFQSVRFMACIGDYASFRFTHFKRAALENSSLIGADWSHSTLQKMFFTACHIDQAVFTGTKLEGIDLSDCRFDGLNVEIEDLNGCMISEQQASSFIGLLGLIIK
ncbi:pentapeptide repeat-containing protein [Paenibacillus hodogayensis]|uniref:Pentapeptide repeat-containing protein n=1 Tax=Paenibacillus hodogayensis TaxID=279208 RepID=A0ABV5W3K5_9BACL